MQDRFNEVTIEDFLTALHDREMTERAGEYGILFMLTALRKGISSDKILSMTLHDFVRTINMPPDIPGWNTMWGERVLYPNR